MLRNDYYLFSQNKKSLNCIQRKRIFDFDQWNIRDVIDGGHCVTYSSLFLNYVNLFNLNNPAKNLDYSALLPILNNFDNKTEFKKYVQDRYFPNYQKLFDCEVAILNYNHETNPDYNLFGTLNNYCKHILNNILEFTTPTFYFINFYDCNQKLFGEPINHIVCVYLSSKTEIHYFDANSGLDFLYLPKDVTLNDLEDNLSELIFKNNFLYRMLINPSSKSMIFNSVISTPLEELTNTKKIIQEYLKLPIENMNMINLDDFMKNEQNFINMNIFIKSNLAQMECSDKHIQNCTIS